MIPKNLNADFPNRTHYHLYANHSLRVIAKVILWFALVLWMSFVNSISLELQPFDKLAIVYSLCTLPLVMLTHYLLCALLRIRSRVWGLMFGPIILLLWYCCAIIMLSEILFLMTIYYAEYGIVHRLYTHLRAEQLSDIFTYRQYLHIFYCVLLYNTLSLAVKIIVDFYDEQWRAYLLIRDHNQMEVALLRARMRPLFFLHTLTEIQDSLPRDHRAKTSIRRLLKLMQFTLSASSSKYISLRREINFLQSYMELEQLRHRSDRLEIRFDTTLIENFEKSVAPLILVNFVENAFKHGINTSTENAYVYISMRQLQDELAVYIENSKPIRHTSSTKSGGIGLENVRKRLEMEYKDAYTLIIKDTQDKFIIELRLPLKP